MIEYPPLQPALPIGYDSWTQVLTDWGLCKAFKKSKKMPDCFAGHPELAAPFVVEISAAIREKQLTSRSAHVAMLRESVVEITYEQAGGPAYIEVFSAMEAAQDRYMATYRRPPDGSDAEGTGSLPLKIEMERCQAAFFAFRRRLEPAVDAARAIVIRRYWESHPPVGIPNTFFINAEFHTVASRMSRIDPSWWGLFFGKLQEPFSHGHPAEGCLLDELAQLRLQAKKKKYAAMIAEWREENADRWGWYGRTHHRMLAKRAVRKAEQVVAWFNAHAPGYLEDTSVRAALHRSLAERLSVEDGWNIPDPGEFGEGSAHWRRPVCAA